MLNSLTKYLIIFTVSFLPTLCFANSNNSLIYILVDGHVFTPLLQDCGAPDNISMDVGFNNKIVGSFDKFEIDSNGYKVFSVHPGTYSISTNVNNNKTQITNNSLKLNISINPGSNYFIAIKTHATCYPWKSSFSIEKLDSLLSANALAQINNYNNLLLELHKTCMGPPVELNANYKSQKEKEEATSSIIQLYKTQKNSGELKEKCDSLYSTPQAIKLFQ